MKNNNHKEILITCRRTAQSCVKHLRQKAIQVINYLLPSLPLRIDAEQFNKSVVFLTLWGYH